jgi:hypothetical protein
MDDDRSYGWLWVVIAGVLLAVAAAGVNAFSHGALTTSGVLTFSGGVVQFLGGVLGLVAFLVVVGGLLWLMNPTLAGMKRPRARITLLGLLVAGAFVVAFALIRSNQAPPSVAKPSPSGSVARGLGVGPPPADSADWTGPALLIGALVVIVLVATFIAWRRQVRLRERIAAPVSPAVPPLAMAARAGRDAVLAGDMSPRAAIIRCFGAMEEALAGHEEASPRASDTPGEVLRHGWQAGLIRPGPANRLLDLFATARFSDHLMTERDRTDAADALSEMLDDLQERAR